MGTLNSFKSSVFNVNNQNFDAAAISLFKYQAANNIVYGNYINNLGIDIQSVKQPDQIPFLPIRFFKSQEIITGNFEAQATFLSSGTTAELRSKHMIEDLSYYKEVSRMIFTRFFGTLQNALVIGLLPSYLERNDSSLVFMVDHFIKTSQNEDSGFYLYDYDELIDKLKKIQNQDRQVFLFGVTFALLELAKYALPKLKDLHIIETGGMKGRGKELIRDELHTRLKNAFGVENIYSEYGMTELLSQAYLTSEHGFQSPPWMSIMIRDLHDPRDFVADGVTGGINVIDLANAHSCAFIETEDIGIKQNQSFQVMGRMDNSDVRGCNLMVS